MRVEKQMELISFNVPCPCRGERILAAEYEGGKRRSAGCRRAKRDDDEGEDKNAKLPLHAAPEVFNNNINTKEMLPLPQPRIGWPRAPTCWFANKHPSGNG